MFADDVGASEIAAPEQPVEWRQRQIGGRAKQEIDYGRPGTGYIFGAFQPATGEAFTLPYDGRTTANGAGFLEKVEEWVSPEAQRVYAIVDNLNVHRATDVLLLSLGHPRWGFVLQPQYAPYLNLIEPWWKILRSVALEGRRFESWAEPCQAVREATIYWNAHPHPFGVAAAIGPAAYPESHCFRRWHKLVGYTT